MEVGESGLFPDSEPELSVALGLRLYLSHGSHSRAEPNSAQRAIADRDPGPQMIFPLDLARTDPHHSLLSSDVATLTEPKSFITRKRA